jgi:hypothetical protein
MKKSKETIIVKISLSDEPEEKRNKMYEKGMKYVYYLLKKMEEEGDMQELN